MKRVLFAVFSIAGTAVLGWLGNWQLDRLAWKQTVLEQIDQRIVAPAVPVPLTPVPSEDTYLPVFAEGRFGQEYNPRSGQSEAHRSWLSRDLGF